MNLHPLEMQASKAAFYYNVIKWSLSCHKQLINLGIVSSFPPIPVLPVCKSRSDILWELWLYMRPDFIVTSVNSIGQSQLTPGCVSVLKLFVGLLLCDLVVTWPHRLIFCVLTWSNISE